MNREEHDDEDHTPIKVRGCARSRVRDSFAMNEADDWMRRQAQGALVGALLPRVRDIRRMGAAAVDLCSVACGRLDAYYEHGLAWWDLAAGSLVATEAGAVVAPLGDAPLRAGSVVAATPAIAGPLRDLLTSLGAQKVP